MNSTSDEPLEAWEEAHDWSDLTAALEAQAPSDSSSGGVAEIVYPAAYSRAIGRMCALMGRGEYSARALAAAQAVIEANPAHYSAWNFRLAVVRACGRNIVPRDKWIFHAPLPELEEEEGEEEEEEEEEEEGGDGDEEEVREEVKKTQAAEAEASDSDTEALPATEDYEWLNRTTLDNAKNYQVWHYRQQLAPSAAAASVATVKLYYGLERLLVELVLAQDAKNYHAWSHLVWLVGWLAAQTAAVRAAGNTDKAAQLDAAVRLGVPTELAFVESLLFHDVYNNSAWSFRHFVVSSEIKESSAEVDAIVAREVTYVGFCLDKAPQNESPWNYVSALCEDNAAGSGAAELLALAQRYAPLELRDGAPSAAEPGEVVLQSTHAVEVLARLYAQRGDTVKAKCALALLKTYIPMRRGYWAYLESRLPGSRAAADPVTLAGLSVGA